MIHPSRFARRACTLLALALSLHCLTAAETDTRTFDVPAGGAEVTLKEFTRQARVQLVFDSDKVAGVRTAAVQGEVSPRVALDRMFAGTGLVAEQDKTSGAFTVRRESPAEAKNGAGRPTNERTANVDTNASTHPDSARAGTISGRVSNAATRSYLEHVEVRLAGSPQVAVTDREGQFVLTNVPAGPQELVATYTGLDEARVTAVVRAGETTATEIAMNSGIYKLNSFVVASDREGRAEAIASQRRAQNLKKIVAADEFGNLSEGNVGEVLRNLPGIDMEFSGTDPQTIKVRGIDAALTGFTIDGNNYANAASSGANRKFELEAMAVQNVEKIEVTMAPTPAQDGTAIGGAVNLVSRGPFGQKGRRISVSLSETITTLHPELDRVYFPDNHGKRLSAQPGGSLLYSETFGAEKNFGVVLTLSQSHKMSFTDQANKTWNYPGTPTPGIPLEAPNYTYLRSYNGGVGGNDLLRRGASLNLAYKLSPRTTLSLNNQWNDFYNRLRGATLAFNINQGTIAAGANENRTEATPTTNANTNVQLNGTGFNKYTENWSFNPGMKHTFSAWTIDYDGVFSKSVNHYRTTDEGFFNSISTRLPANVGFIIEGAPDNPSPSITQTAGPDYRNPNNYTGMTTAGRTNHSRDVIAGGKFNVRRSFSGKWPFYLQAGGKFVNNYRWITQPNRAWTYVGPDGIRGNADDNQNYAQFVDPEVDYPHTFLRQPPTGWLDVHRAYNYFLKNPQAFQEDTVAAYTNYVRNKRYFYENVQAGYVMGSVNVGRLNLLGGARFEHTDVGGVGFQQRTSPAINAIPDLLERAKAQYGGPSLRSNSHYGDLLPNLQANYRFTPNFVVRAAATKALGRPQLDQIVPNVTVSEPSGGTAGTINLVKAGLKPQHSTNYDLSVEYYFEPVGVLSAGVFRREIKDYIATLTTPVTAGMEIDGLDGDYTGYNLTQRLNAGTSIQEGLELSYSQQLSFLPGWAKGFGVMANVTFITANTELSGQAKIYEVPNIVPRIYNVGINYRHRAFSARVKLNVRSAYVTNIPGASAQKNFRGQQAQVAANFDAAFARRLKLTLDINNVFNEQPYSYTTKESRMTNKGTWGAYVTLGVKYDL
jgi:iron complex outermembrane receptor protein